MGDKILILYGSYRSDRQGIRLVSFLMAAFAARGASPELIDAKAVSLPMLDRMYKEYSPGEAPAAMAELEQHQTTRNRFAMPSGLIKLLFSRSSRA